MTTEPVHPLTLGAPGRAPGHSRLTDRSMETPVTHAHACTPALLKAQTRDHMMAEPWYAAGRTAASPSNGGDRQRARSPSPTAASRLPFPPTCVAKPARCSQALLCGGRVRQRLQCAAIAGQNAAAQAPAEAAAIATKAAAVAAKGAAAEAAAAAKDGRQAGLRARGRNRNAPRAVRRHAARGARASAGIAQQALKSLRSRQGTQHNRPLSTSLTPCTLCRSRLFSVKAVLQKNTRTPHSY